MNKAPPSSAPASRLQRTVFPFLALAATFAVSAPMLFGGASSIARSASQPKKQPEKKPMKPFVLIFRQGARPLSPADLEARGREVVAWAARHNAEGHKLDPRILDSQSHRLAPDGDADLAPQDAPLTALLFLEAADIAQAVEIARSHPGVRFGASVEVRPWSPPISPAQP